MMTGITFQGAASIVVGRNHLVSLYQTIYALMMSKKTAGINYYHYIRLTAVIATLTVSQFSWPAYNRHSWGFNPTQSEVNDSLIGWYSGVAGSPTDIDHIVALKDAYLSGGSAWSNQKKRAFSNDPYNQVPANPYVNRVIKNEYPPLKFITRMLLSDYEFDSNKCLRYVQRYVDIKSKYGLNVNTAESQSASLLCLMP